MFSLILVAVCMTAEPNVQELYAQCVSEARANEVKLLDEYVVRLESMLRLPVKSKQQLRQRGFIRQQTDYTRKYMKKLQAGKIPPVMPQLDPFKLQPNMIGTIGRTREDLSIMLRVVERVKGGVMVRAEKTQRVRGPEHQSSGGTVRIEDHGASLQQALSSGYNVKRRGSVFFVEGVDGEPDKEISLPGVWLVLPGPTTKQMRLHRVPATIHSPPAKPLAHPLYPSHSLIIGG